MMDRRCLDCTQPSSGGLPLCDVCHDRTANELEALDADYVTLGALEPRHRGPQTRVSGTTTPGVPIDLDADEIARAIAWRCSVWEPPVREAAGLPPAPERGRPAVLVARASAVFAGSLSAFLALPPTWGYPDGPDGGCVARTGVQGALDLRRLHRRAVALVGIVRPAVHLPGVCRRCGATALLQADGGGDVECGHCGRRISPADYHTDLASII